jgi:cell division protein FtsZ
MSKIKPGVETFAKIKVVGVGGGGGNAIDRMIKSEMTGVEFIAIDTNTKVLHRRNAKKKISIGKNLTHGLGAGMNPEVGQKAAEENKDEIYKALENADMIFVVYGAGGGTGSGAGHVVAEIAKETGALTVGVVSRPFSFEGSQRSNIAEESITTLRERVDSLIVIQNDKLLNIIKKDTPMLQAFSLVDDILKQAVQGIANLVTNPGEVNIDFADIRTTMKDGGDTLISVETASGKDRITKATKQAINSPLLNIAIDGAKSILLNVGSFKDDVALAEIEKAVNIATEKADPNAKIIFGASVDKSVKKGEIKITAIITNFKSDQDTANNIIPQFEISEG